MRTGATFAGRKEGYPVTLDLFWQEVCLGSLKSVLSMAAVIIPIMLGIEILRDINVLDRFTSLLRPLVRLFSLPAEAAVPLLAGLVFGIAYGAGVIIQASRAGRLTGRDLYLVNTFLVICHSVIEDTILFLAIGANLAVILGWRVFLAILICYALSRRLRRHTAAAVGARQQSCRTG